MTSAPANVEQRISAGTVFVEEESASRVMYIIKSGKARVFKKYHDVKITLAHLGAGDICGELSLFDARPRSASVEALSDLVVVVVDVAKGNHQMANLPDWAQAMMRTLANRIREADKQIFGLRSVAQYQKKTQRVDQFSRILYGESFRIIKLAQMLHQDLVLKKESLTPDQFKQMLLELVGPQVVSFNCVWEFMRETQIISYSRADHSSSPPLALDEAKHKEVIQRLDIEIKSGRFLMLGNSADIVLEKMIRVMIEKPSTREFSKEQIVAPKNGMPVPEVIYHEGVAELAKSALIDAQKDHMVFSCDPDEIKKTRPIQELFRRLDETAQSPADVDDELKAA